MVLILGRVFRAALFLPASLVSHRPLKPLCDFYLLRTGPSVALHFLHDGGDLRHVFVVPAIENILDLAFGRAERFPPLLTLPVFTGSPYSRFVAALPIMQEPPHLIRAAIVCSEATIADCGLCAGSEPGQS